MSASVKQPDLETEAIDTEDESLSSAQEAVPVPLFWGKRKIAVRWISPVYQQIAVESSDRPGKK